MPTNWFRALDNANGFQNQNGFHVVKIKMAFGRSGKYNAKRTEFNGKMYSSAKEARRAYELHLLARAGAITELREQVVYVLAPSVVIQDRKRPALRYIADFEYMQNTCLVIEDCKGVITPEYRIKRHLMKSVLGLDITET